MPALARGQINTPSIVNWFTTINGNLTDMFEVGFQIWDISGGLPGTQVFPSVPDSWETITDSPGHYSVGHYYAYDNLNAHGWQPGLAEPIGTHRAVWRWKASVSSPYQSGAEDFEVLVESHGGTADWYISVQDVRDAGLSETDYPEPTVIAAIELWQQFLERACRQWFNLRSLIFSVDGNDSDTLHFGVPIVSIEYLKLNNGSDPLSTDMFRIYSGNTYPDDRGNPCIKLVGPDFTRDIFVQPITGGRMKFRKGRKNQEIKGIFGYVESDGSTPKMIKRALLLLVTEKLVQPFVPTAGLLLPVLGSVLSETTDGHSISYGSLIDGFSPRRPGLSGITQNVEVLDIIKLYRAPLGIASPANWTYD